jgi:hypothetical protein
MIDLCKSLTLCLEREKSVQEGQTASQGSREMVESEAFCAQYSSDSTILFQRLVAMRSSLEMSHCLEWDRSQLQHGRQAPCGKQSSVSHSSKDRDQTICHTIYQSLCYICLLFALQCLPR